MGCVVLVGGCLYNDSLPVVCVVGFCVCYCGTSGLVFVWLFVVGLGFLGLFILRYGCLFCCFGSLR